MSAPHPRTGPAQDDDLAFVDEASTAGGNAPGGGCGTWRVMIVDADAGMHASTTFALDGLALQGRALAFVHAYSLAEARRLLAADTDLAVILLDAAMEQGGAGLQLVRHIRETLGRRDVRLILATARPGDAPDLDAIRAYDLHDYHPKSELTRARLYTTVAAAIRAYEQIRLLTDSSAGLARVVRANAALMTLHTAAEMARGILREASSLLGQPDDGLLLAGRQEAAGWPVLAASGAAAGFARAGVLAPGDTGPAGLVARTLAARNSLHEDGWLTLLFQGKAGGDFCACLRAPHPVGPLQRGLLDVFASSIGVGLDNVALMTDLQRAAFHDPLTGLPNRVRLVELIDGHLAACPQADATLCLVDIDNFAETNDALGHQFGDALLVAVARRLRALLDPRLVLARIGGDVFCVLGPAGDIDPDALQALFDAPFSIDGQDVQVSSTLGLVRLDEHDGNGADALKDADIALKRAKTRRRGGHFYFSRGMGVEIRERVRLMHALRGGFARGELFLVYQPQVELGARRPFGAEALLRWRLEDGRFIPPDRFIPIAEYSGLIIEIGAWVLREACAELMRIRNAGHLDFTMSVNVSQAQFRHPLFLDMLRDALASSGAPPERVELEITESMAMEEPELLIERLAEIKRTGVSIAIDDFGTGFSSLSYLQRLQVDRLKIDRAFVSEITGSARGSSIAEMVVELGRNLGLAIIAEGVEDERQAQILQGLGCPLAQGYLFSRPLAPDALLAWLGSDALHAA